MAPELTLPTPHSPTPPRRPSPIRRRLWLAGLGMLLFLSALVTASQMTGASLLGGNYGADLIPSYMAGNFVREGRPDKLMNLAEAARFQAHLRRVWHLEQHGRTGPWLNPPFYAWVFVPLSALPYPEARAAWLVCNLVMAGGAMWLLGRLLSSEFTPSPLYPGERAGVRGRSRKTPDGRFRALSHAAVPAACGFADGGAVSDRAPVRENASGEDAPVPSDSVPPGFRILRRCPSPQPSPLSTGEREFLSWPLILLLMVTSMPFIQAMASQQNTFLSLLLLTAAAWFWRRNQALRAGLIAGLLLFKPQLAAVLAVALCCSLGRRAFLGLATTATALLLATTLAMPGALTDYFEKLPTVLPWLKAGGYYPWSRQVTFQGFWRMLIQGPVTGPAPLAVRLLWPACSLAAGAMLLPGLVRAWKARNPDGTAHDRLIAATVAATPLLMPYYMDYDLLLLAVPAVLFAAERCRSAKPAPDRVDRLLLAGWGLLFPLLFLNAAFADATRVSLTVPLLAGMAGLYALRAARPAEAQSRLDLPVPAGPPLLPSQYQSAA